jgi:acetyl esterase/lipase
VKFLRRAFVGGFVFVLVVLGAGLALVATPLPDLGPPRDVFGFADLAGSARPADLQPVDRYTARDGAELAYRLYAAPTERVLVFVHGSSYHGAGYHALARRVADSGAATVVLPNLRGHHLSGDARGDVAYIGQLEDDLADLIAQLRARGHAGQIALGGHSSGGGLVIRFAGGPHAPLVARQVLLSPLLPLAPTTRGGDAGGWAILHAKRLYGLIALNSLGIRGLNGLSIIRFAKPEALRDGTETLVYSYRLNTSYHPRVDWAGDLAGLAEGSLLIVGEDDEANDAFAYAPLLAEHAAGVRVVVLPGVDHFGVFTEPAALDLLVEWLR